MARSCSLSQAALEASNRMRQVSHWPPGQLSLEDVLRTLDLLEHRTSGLLLLRRPCYWQANDFADPGGSLDLV